MSCTCGDTAGFGTGSGAGAGAASPATAAAASAEAQKHRHLDETFDFPNALRTSAVPLSLNIAL